MIPFFVKKNSAYVYIHGEGKSVSIQKLDIG